MMTASFTIAGRLCGLNDLIAAERSNKYKGAAMKRDAQNWVMLEARKQLHGVRFARPVRLSYLFVEPNRRRDHDNVSGFAHKVVQDALVACGVLADDGWDEVVGYVDTFAVDRKRPRIEVTIEEVE